MTKGRQKRKSFKVYYFTGDYFSSKGEKRHSTIIEADNEHDAEVTFKQLYPNYSFGWVDEIMKE